MCVCVCACDNVFARLPLQTHQPFCPLTPTHVYPHTNPNTRVSAHSHLTSCIKMHSNMPPSLPPSLTSIHPCTHLHSTQKVTNAIGKRLLAVLHLNRNPPLCRAVEGVHLAHCLPEHTHTNHSEVRACTRGCRHIHASKEAAMSSCVHIQMRQARRTMIALLLDRIEVFDK